MMLLPALIASLSLVGEVVLSECSVFPTFDPHAIRYHNNGPSMYGVWFYDLTYRRNKSVLLTDDFGHVQCEQPVTRSSLETAHFELNEQFGTADDVARDVKAWLAGRTVERCP